MSIRVQQSSIFHLSNLIIIAYASLKCLNNYEAMQMILYRSRDYSTHYLIYQYQLIKNKYVLLDLKRIGISR